MARTFKRPPSPEELRRARNRLIIYVLLGVVAVALLVVLALYLRVTGGPALPAEVRQRIQTQQRQAKAPVGAAPHRPAEVPAGTPPLRQQIQEAQQAAQTGDAATRTLYVTDNELNAELADVAQDHKQVKDVKAYFGKNRAYLVTEVEFSGRNLTVTLTLKPLVADGGLQFEMESAHLGGMAAPEKLLSAAQQQLKEKGNLFKPAQTGLYIEKVQIKEGVAILTGRPVARR